LHDALPILVGLSDEGLLTTQIMHRTTPSTLKILAPSAATPSPGLRPPSPHGRGSNKLQFTLPSPPSGEEDEGLISLHGVRGDRLSPHEARREPRLPEVLPRIEYLILFGDKFLYTPPLNIPYVNTSIVPYR